MIFLVPNQWSVEIVDSLWFGQQTGKALPRIRDFFFFFFFLGGGGGGGSWLDEQNPVGLFYFILFVHVFGIGRISSRVVSAKQNTLLKDFGNWNSWENSISSARKCVRRSENAMLHAVLVLTELQTSGSPLEVHRWFLLFAATGEHPKLLVQISPKLNTHSARTHSENIGRLQSFTAC